MSNGVTMNSVLNAKSRLADLPTKQKHRISRKEAVIAMRAEIEGALERGYSLEEVMSILSEEDKTFKELNPATVRTYLRIGKTRESDQKTAPKADDRRTESATPPQIEKRSERPSEDAHSAQKIKRNLNELRSRHAGLNEDL